MDIQHSNSKDVRFRLWLILMALAIFGAALAALCMGQFSIPVRTVFEQLLGRGEDTGNIRTVLFRIRIPRIIMASVSGAGLACAGAAFQSLFGNPLATPDTLGVANAASFGAALGILLGQNAAAVQGLALVFGMAAVFLVFLLTGRRGMPRSILAIVLSGLVVSSLFSALVSLIKYVADPQDVLPVITFWLMGSFSGVTKAGVARSIPMILAGTVLIFGLRYRLNALALSEEETRSLGINVRTVRILVILSASMTTASVVASCGVIGWVGLLIPHISRMLFGNDNRYVVPSSIALGALFMLCVDTVARCISAAEIPVSILTAVIGAPVFLLLLRRTGGLSA